MATLLNENNEIINPLIEAITTGEYEYGAAISEDVEVFFNDPSSTFSHLVAVKKGFNLVRFALNDADPSECVVSGDSIMYPEAFLDTDIYYTVSSGELKEDIILNTPAAPRTFIFTLESEGVTAQLQEDRSIDYLDSATGELVWSIQEPYALDANGIDVPVELVFGEGLYSLTVNTDESTAYPIRLDPTIMVGTLHSTGTLGGRPIVKDSLGRWYSVFRKSIGQLGVYRSDDLSTWTAITGHEVTGQSLQYFGSLAADSTGNVHMVWEGRDAASNLKFKIKHAKFDGTVWTPWKNIGILANTYNETRAQTCIGNDGVIHVVFSSMDPASPSLGQIKYVKSSDGGATWTPWINISKVAFEQYIPSIAVGADNVIHVAWHARNALSVSNPQIYYSKSSDGGTTWSEGFNVSNLDGLWQGQASLTVDNDNRPRIVWTGNTPEIWQVAIQSRYDGTAWTAAESINPYFGSGVYRYNPSVVVDPQGNTHVVAYGRIMDSDSYNQALYIKHDGTSWGPWQAKSLSHESSVFGIGLPAKFDYSMPVMYTITSSGAYAEVITTEHVAPFADVEDTADFDLARRTAVGSLADADTSRAVTATVASSSSSDTARTLRREDIAIYDSKRPVNVEDSVLYDTVRAVKALPVTLGSGFVNSDTLRKVARTSTGVWYTAWDQSGQIRCRQSSDLVTWMSVDPPAITGTGQYSPSIAIDLNDRVHLIWTSAAADNTACEIKHRTYDGASWSDVNTLVSKINGVQYSNSSIYADSQGSLHVTWRTDSASGAKTLTYRTSGDGGSTWSAPEQISSSSFMGSGSLDVSPTGTVRAVWSGYDTGGHSAVRYAVRGSSGVWESLSHLMPSIPSYGQEAPILSITPDGIQYLVWLGYDAGSNSKTKVKFSKSNDDGLSWSAWSNIADIGNYTMGYNVTCSMDPEGKLHAVWAGNDAANPTIRQAFHTVYDGTSWSSYEKLTSETGNVMGPTLPLEHDYRMPLIYERGGLIKSVVVDSPFPDALAVDTSCDLFRRLHASYLAASDTKRAITLSIEELIDIFRRITAASTGLFDSYRPVTVAFSSDSDALRKLLAVAETGNDTTRTLNVLDSESTDTERRTMTTQEELFDTYTRLVAASTSGSDAIRRLIAMDSTFMDTARRIQRLIETGQDTTRRTSTAQAGLFDSYRPVLLAASSAADTERYIIAAMAGLYDSHRPLLLGSSSSADTYRMLTVLGSSSMDAARRIVKQEEAGQDTTRRITAAMAELYDSRRPVLVTDSQAVDTFRRLLAAAHAGTDTVRRTTAIHAGLHDTFREILAADSLDADAFRRLMADSLTDLDTQRALNVLDSLSMDTVRRLFLESQADLDVSRRTAVTDRTLTDTLRTLGLEDSALYDSARHLLKACETQRDITRRIVVASSTSHDTLRIMSAVYTAIEAVFDLKRRTAVPAGADADTVRRVAAAMHMEMDIVRSLLVNDEAYSDTQRDLIQRLIDVVMSFDTARTLTKDDEALMDTLRNLISNGTVELTMSFVADLMGTLRLQY